MHVIVLTFTLNLRTALSLNTAGYVLHIKLVIITNCAFKEDDELQTTKTCSCCVLHDVQLCTDSSL